MTSYSARTVTQIDSPEILFTDGRGPLDQVSNISTLQPVYAVATSRGPLATRGSQSLLFSNFGITDTATVLGIELELSVSRLARIQDNVIQLWYRGSAQGQNKANLAAEDLQLYGGATDLWGTKNISVTDPSFAVMIDLQPHTQYPSSNTVYLRSLSIRIYTA
jgi:hypothetical protein